MGPPASVRQKEGFQTLTVIQKLAPEQVFLLGKKRQVGAMPFRKPPRDLDRLRIADAAREHAPALTVCKCLPLLTHGLSGESKLVLKRSEGRLETHQRRLGSAAHTGRRGRLSTGRTLRAPVGLFQRLPEIPNGVLKRLMQGVEHELGVGGRYRGRGGQFRKDSIRAAKELRAR